MHCPDCNTVNDPDARYCSECGRVMSGDAKTQSAITTRAYFFALLLIPVVALAGGLGYYKFFLPEGIAAVVNGEEIKRSELDSAVALTQAKNGEENFKGDQSARYARRLRYEVLSGLVTERLVLQEARKAGISASPEDVASAVSRAQVSSGMDKNNFHALVMQRFGGIPSFEEAVRRELIIKRIIASQAVPQGGDPKRAGDAVNAWLEDLSARASVRIALSEQWSGAGCGCGDPKTQQAADRGCAMTNTVPSAGRAECRHPKNGPSAHTGIEKEAADAGLAYWHAKYGNDAVTTRSADFGCHIQMDILKDEKVIGSLRYQDGSITERLGRR